MDLEKFALQAYEECGSSETTAHQGGIQGKGFWNAEATQFMYVPAFQFAPVPGCRRYLYEARDENGILHTFEGKTAHELLTPIWRDIPEGMVELNVTALEKDGRTICPTGTRTFFRLSPFPGRTQHAACSYRECVEKAFAYTMRQSFVKHWIEHNAPDPHYDLNVYPSKINGRLIAAMLAYAELNPEAAKEALEVAVKAADYVLSITPGENDPLCGLPPTYSFAFCDDPGKNGIYTGNWRAAKRHAGTIMMVYPAFMGTSYILLEKATGDKKYLEAAMKIGEYYLTHVEKNGSWYVVRSCETGEPLCPQYIVPTNTVVPFLMSLYDRTNDKKWRGLADKAMEYVENELLPSYCWEAQFEDTDLYYSYHNLTHFSPCDLIRQYCKYYPDDERRMAAADELMRFVEDQFVVWKRPAPRNDNGYDTTLWHTPAGLEQYLWYVPIDSSTAGIAATFYVMYKAGRGELHLVKALALADQITNMQHPDGKIPTHWMNCRDAEEDFWFNCMFFSMSVLSDMAEADDDRRKNTLA